ncbi:MAG: sulfatase-like hydrolase/transferase [Tagaea sp.]|nr:sulfatase-like hydrolase/transferase [Tagaea sp.]
MATPGHLVVVMADEFERGHMGCAGGPVRTPNLDRLAASGTRFAGAYCNSPICVPSRASFATGRHVHEIGYWDNAHPYDGKVESWAHRLAQAGRQAVSIGKLHFRRTSDPNGFTQEIMPMHVVGGVGDLLGAIRDPMPRRSGARRLSEEVGRGATSYSEYDSRICAAACAWIAKHARDPEPWVLFVSFVCPHMPFKAPAEFYDLYADDPIELPPVGPGIPQPHPWLAALTACISYADHFDAHSAREAIRGYRALCTFVDANVGRIVAALDGAGLGATARVLFTSDHGESLGRRGIWGKSNMYEQAAGVPLILAGADVPRGRVCGTPVSLVDAYPTILAAAGVAPGPPDMPGCSLFELAAGADPGRVVLGEYHAVGASAAAFMLRRRNHKYVHYVGMRPQLFDLASDPDETRDLALDPAHAPLLAEFEALLRERLDPEAVDRRARAEQAATIAAHGGLAAVLARGDFHYSPVPGQPAQFN